MLKKIKQIRNLGVFQDFHWDNEVKNKDGSIRYFEAINIIYGRNYSGKTTISRIFRALETGSISDKYGNPYFCMELADGSKIEMESKTENFLPIRVFNEDFVRDNLRFIIDPDASVEPFAILGDDNNKI